MAHLILLKDNCIHPAPCLFTATGIKAKIIVEGANAPTTPGGDAIINDKGILVVPDILANSGGVIVSYFEWVQDKQNYFWSADEVKSNLNDIMMRSFKEVEEMAKSKKVSWREAAHMIGVARVQKRIGCAGFILKS